MIELNNVKFNKNTKKGLWFKPLKNKIKLFNDNLMIGVITKHKVLAKATKENDGRFWYNYGVIEEIGEYESYTKLCDDIKKALEVNNILT